MLRHKIRHITLITLKHRDHIAGSVVITVNFNLRFWNGLLAEPKCMLSLKYFKTGRQQQF